MSTNCAENKAIMGQLGKTSNCNISFD